MEGCIFLIQGDNHHLVRMAETPYDIEKDLQTLLATYPDLLAGDQMDSQVPRQWLLVEREAKIPSEEGGAARWSVDHLFLDQDGIPTLVEVKRSSDTRLRREVVGQMLDYAANALLYWPMETIRARLEAKDPHQDWVLDLLGPDADLEAFWEKVKTNLQAGKIRLVFVADSIPSELRRIIEFLNKQMDPAQVFGVEIKQFTDAPKQVKTLVPTVVGEIIHTNGGGWDKEKFIKVLTDNQGSDVAQVAAKIHDWGKTHQPPINWGKGNIGSFSLTITHNNVPYFPISVTTEGNIEVRFSWLRQKPPFHDEGLRRELLAKLNPLIHNSLPDSAINGNPKIPCADFIPSTALDGFLTLLGWITQQIKALPTSQ